MAEAMDVDGLNRVLVDDKAGTCWDLAGDLGLALDGDDGGQGSRARAKFVISNL